MNIEISFGERSLLSPKLTVKDASHRCAVTHLRWIQLISLLSFKKINNLDDGRVTVVELKHSIAFRKLAHENVARFFLGSIRHLPTLLQDFIRNHLILPASGSFSLRLDAMQIEVDRNPLTAYVHATFGSFNESESRNIILLEGSKAALKEFEFRSASFYLSNYLRATEGNPVSSQILAYLNLATVEYILQGNTPALNSIMIKARTLIHTLKRGNERTLLHAFYFDRLVWIAPAKSYKSFALNRANNAAIDLASELPVSNSDRMRLLAGRYYFNAYRRLRYSSKPGIDHNIRIVRELFHDLRDSEPSQFYPHEVHTKDILELQMIMIRRVNAGEPASSEELDMYRNFVKIAPESALSLLATGEWISASFIRTQRPDLALKFLTEALIEHARLHQTLVYERVKKLHAKLIQQSYDI